MIIKSRLVFVTRNICSEFTGKVKAMGAPLALYFDRIDGTPWIRYRAYSSKRQVHHFFAPFREKDIQLYKAGTPGAYALLVALVEARGNILVYNRNTELGAEEIDRDESDILGLGMAGLVPCAPIKAISFILQCLQSTEHTMIR